MHSRRSLSAEHVVSRASFGCTDFEDEFIFGGTEHQQRHATFDGLPRKENVSNIGTVNSAHKVLQKRKMGKTEEST